MKARILGLTCGLLFGAQGALAADDLEARYNSTDPILVLDMSALYMTRSAPDSLGIVGTVGSTVNADQFDFDWETGLDASVSLRLAEGWNLEYRGLFPHEFECFFDVATGGGGAYLFDPPVPYAAAELSFDYTSEMTSHEANLRYQLNDTWGLLAGARFIDLSEDVYTIRTIGAPVFAVGWGADNKMKGGQIGIEGAWSSGNFGLDVAVKAGLFHNSIETYADVEQPVGTNAYPRATGSFNEHSYSIEGSIETRYHLTQNASIYAGYQFLFLDQVALAPGQIRHADIVNTSEIGGVELSDILYHGVKFGLVVKF